ncbi:SDR family oxidoreductase [Actinomadura kijaniata]|uniref:NAD(P)-dependent dehydrogenase (Short-subunit alcohol dehydrogenase family) n=1 Tax=Actinomadura namibiensis TaxID=182080 RepID=A0A7W3LXU3_ACTNM|nr:SDR family NAD(P)-dependent oxidoreductase [Actinomadura namibiensis]MBA8956326.1 NAD(P)-dependent dehydrogenase (short-subunit alcohol dehydrogenase family) [Actinomadura namibiensis]
MAFEGAGKVALITGGSNGIGAAVARRLAEQGAHLVLADVDRERGGALAKELDAAFVRCDVREPDDSKAAVATAVERFGGLDLAFLNAGVASGFTLGDDFDVERYRRAMAVNLDGVVYGVHAALPALRARGGGDIIATASMAGLTPIPLDPVYGANKTAVVGLVRSLGPAYAAENIRVNALCPSFAHTDIIDHIRDHLVSTNFPILEVSAVVDAFLGILNAEGTGEAWFVVPGRPSEPFKFRGVPGPR